MCARVFILIYSYGCFFAPHQLSDSGIYTCVATSSSGETSWSAFLEVKGETRLYDCMNAPERTFILCFFEDRDSFLQSFQNQVEWWSWKTTMRTSFQARRPNLRSPMSPRTVCRYPGSPAWLERHLYPLLSSRHLGWFYQQHQWHL